MKRFALLLTLVAIFGCNPQPPEPHVPVEVTILDVASLSVRGKVTGYRTLVELPNRRRVWLDGPLGQIGDKFVHDFSESVAKTPAPKTP